MIQISSPVNPQVRLWQSLLTSKGIRSEGLFLLSGEKLIREFACSRDLEIVAEILSSHDEAISQAPRTYRLAADLFKKLDELGTHHPILVVKTPKIEKWDAHSLPEGLEIVCPLGDPQNLGAVLRSAEAFGASKVILTEDAANPFLPKTIKASAGSSLRVNIEKGPKLSALEGSFVALDLDGESLTDFKWKKNARILVGEEGPGLSALSSKAKLQKISIPTSGVESLNAGVATGIALFHYRSQFKS